MNVNRPTFTLAMPSTRLYPPPSNSHRENAYRAITQISIATAGKIVCKTCPTPANIAPIWNNVIRIIATQSQTTHETPTFGPGIRLNPPRPVLPVAIVKRPISACNAGLMRQLMMISQRHVIPTSAPSDVVAISSPEPTMDAARIIPGPMRFMESRKVTGGASTAVAS